MPQPTSPGETWRTISGGENYKYKNLPKDASSKIKKYLQVPDTLHGQPTDGWVRQRNWEGRGGSLILFYFKGVRLYADLGINFHNFFVFWIWMMQFGTERANGCF